MTLFDALGFRWGRPAVPAPVSSHSLERVCFRFYKMLLEFVWDASVLEDYPFTFPKVEALLDGVTIGERKIADQEQVLNLAASSKRLLTMVKSRQFEFSKPVFAELNGIVARKEALERGTFRGEGQEKHYTPDVGLGEHGRYTPLPTLSGAPELNRVFHAGVAALQSTVHWIPAFAEMTRSRFLGRYLHISASEDFPLARAGWKSEQARGGPAPTPVASVGAAPCGRPSPVDLTKSGPARKLAPTSSVA